MMKMAGALLIIGTSTIWGVKKAGVYKGQLEQLKYLQKIIYLIQSEIRYSREFLGEIFWKIGQNLREPYNVWMMDMSEWLDDFTGDSFETIWKNSIEKHLKGLDLPKCELESLKALGNQLGYADVKLQMKLLDLYQDHLERTIGEVHGQVQTKVRLYHCLGVMSGLFVAVLLF